MGSHETLRDRASNVVFDRLEAVGVDPSSRLPRNDTGPAARERHRAG